jgi:hypothetical protein
VVDASRQQLGALYKHQFASVAEISRRPRQFLFL